MLGEDMKSLAGDLTNYNWKIFACSAVFDTIYYLTAGAIDRFFCACRRCGHAGWCHDF
jgi:hypothetical protein